MTARRRPRAAPGYKPHRVDAHRICDALNGDHCTCRRNGTACFAWWGLLKLAAGDVDAIIAAERQKLAHNHTPGIQRSITSAELLF